MKDRRALYVVLTTLVAASVFGATPAGAAGGGKPPKPPKATNTFTSSLSSTTPTSVGEAAGGVTVTVTRSSQKGGAAVTLTPAAVTGADAATPSTDFDATPILVQFTSGVTVKSVVIPVIDDAVYEGSERFRADLSAPSGGYQLVAGTSGGEIVIQDDDPAPRPDTAPTADAAAGSGLRDAGEVAVTLTGHDVDGDELTFEVGTATHGLVTVPTSISCDGATPSTCTTTVTYAPNVGFSGTDNFDFTVNDGTDPSAAATATITISELLLTITRVGNWDGDDATRTFCPASIYPDGCFDVRYQGSGLQPGSVVRTYYSLDGSYGTYAEFTVGDSGTFDFYGTFVCNGGVGGPIYLAGTDASGAPVQSPGIQPPC